MTRPDLTELRTQLRAEVLEQVTKVGPRVHPVALDTITEHVMTLVDIYAIHVRDAAQRSSLGLK